MAENILANKCQSRAKLEPKPMTKTGPGIGNDNGKGIGKATGTGMVTGIGMRMRMGLNEDWVRVKFNSATTRANDEQHVANPQLLESKSNMRMGSGFQLWGASSSLSLLIIIFD